MKKKYILITGASSIIGESLARLLVNETEYSLVLQSSQPDKLFDDVEGVEAVQFSSLDKQSAKQLVLERRPEVIVNTIGMSDIERCEMDKRLAWELNANIVENLARLAKITEAHLITLSTDHIFDGKKGPYSEGDLANPINYYGKSKLAGENFARIGCDKNTIIRISDPYGRSTYGKADFINSAVSAFENETEFSALVNYFTNPVYADDVAFMIFKIIQKQRYGIYHAGGPDWLSRYQATTKTAEVFGFPISGFKPAAIEDINQKAKLPKQIGLINLKTETDLGLKFTSLEGGLQALKFQLSEKNSGRTNYFLNKYH